MNRVFERSTSEQLNIWQQQRRCVHRMGSSDGIGISTIVDIVATNIVADAALESEDHVRAKTGCHSIGSCRSRSCLPGSRDCDCLSCERKHYHPTLMLESFVSLDLLNLRRFRMCSARI